MTVLKIRIVLDSGAAIGPGKIELLESIERTGSIRAAAALMKMSYRRAWMLLQALERAFAKPLLETARGGSKGGGASLTPHGRKVVAEYRALERGAIKTGCRSLRKVELLAKRAETPRKSGKN
jgi:molybdate transport system regulatory protein